MKSKSLINKLKLLNLKVSNPDGGNLFVSDFLFVSDCLYIPDYDAVEECSKRWVEFDDTNGFVSYAYVREINKKYKGLYFREKDASFCCGYSKKLSCVIESLTAYYLCLCIENEDYIVKSYFDSIKNKYVFYPDLKQLNCLTQKDILVLRQVDMPKSIKKDYLMDVLNGQ